jgi:hypothetical protein
MFLGSEYINTAFNAALCAVLGSTAPVLRPSTTTRHVSVSTGPSSGVFVVARNWQTDHALRIKLLIFIVLKSSEEF